MGATTIFKKESVQSGVLDELVLALVQMAKNKTGALIIIERNILAAWVSGGIELRRLLADLLLTIFHPDTPLHDGQCSSATVGSMLRPVSCPWLWVSNMRLPWERGTARLWA